MGSRRFKGSDPSAIKKALEARNQRNDPQRAIRERIEREERARVDERHRERTPERWGEDEVSEAREAELKEKGVDVRLDGRRRMKSAVKADIFAQLFNKNALTKEQHAAVRDLQDAMARRARGCGRDEGRAYDDVQADRDRLASSLVNDVMLAAAEKVDLTLEKVGPPSCRLLIALLDPRCEPVEMKVQKRRCAETVKRTLATPKANAMPVGRRSFDARVCDTLNDFDAKHCAGCGGDLASATKEFLLVPEDWRGTVARITGELNAHAQAVPIRIAAQALVDVRDAVERELAERRKARSELRGEVARAAA